MKAPVTGSMAAGADDDDGDDGDDDGPLTDGEA
jgi:hypothetical protein